MQGPVYRHTIGLTIENIASHADFLRVGIGINPRQSAAAIVFASRFITNTYAQNGRKVMSMILKASEKTKI